MHWYKLDEGVINGTTFLRKVIIKGKALCIVGDNNAIYAVAAKCPHAGADLSNGWCDRGQLVCPFHRYSYDLQTGKGAQGQNDFIETFPVEIREDGVYVGITTLAEKIKKLFS